MYEGEQEGADTVALILLEDAIKALFPEYFPKIQKLEHKDAQSPYDALINWFFEGEGFELQTTAATGNTGMHLNSIPP